MSACILIVDDNATNLKLASEVLEMEGYRVVRAVDAEQALRILQGTVPDLILMDIALPGMDGLTLTRQLKSTAHLSKVPIVALSAFAMKGDEGRAMASGCDGYIVKPIDTRKFSEQIQSFVAKE